MDRDTKTYVILIVALLAIIAAAQVALVYLQREALNEDRWRHTVFDNVSSQLGPDEAWDADR